MKNKFNYAMNAIHYCIYREEIWTSNRIEAVLLRFYSLTLKNCLTKRMKSKIHSRYQKSRKELDEYISNKEFGAPVCTAHHIFGSFYSAYFLIFSWIFLGIADKEYGCLKPIPALLIIAIPITLGYIPMYNAVFLKDIYIKYFKQFEKEDGNWYKKWKWITIAFCIGSIITNILGFFCMTIITNF